MFSNIMYLRTRIRPHLPKCSQIVHSFLGMSVRPYYFIYLFYIQRNFPFREGRTRDGPFLEGRTREGRTRDGPFLEGRNRKGRVLRRSTSRLSRTRKKISLIKITKNNFFSLFLNPFLSHVLSLLPSPPLNLFVRMLDELDLRFVWTIRRFPVRVEF